MTSSFPSAGADQPLRGVVLLQRLGDHGSGEVWSAVREPSGEPLVVRRLRLPVERAQRERARQSGAGLAGFTHRHLVPVQEVVLTREGVAVLYSPVPVVTSLARLLELRGTLEPGEIVTVGLPLAEALSRLHEAGAGHGRLSAQDVLLTADGMPLLTGYGITGVLGSAGRPEDDVRDLAAMLLAPLGRAAGPAAAAVAVVLGPGLADDPRRRPAAAELAAGLAASSPPVPVRLASPGEPAPGRRPAAGGTGPPAGLGDATSGDEAPGAEVVAGSVPDGAAAGTENFGGAPTGGRHAVGAGGGPLSSLRSAALAHADRRGPRVRRGPGDASSAGAVEAGRRVLSGPNRVRARGAAPSATESGTDTLTHRPDAPASGGRLRGRGLWALPAVVAAVLAVGWLGWQTGRAAEAPAAPVAADAPATLPASGGSAAAAAGARSRVTGRPVPATPGPTTSRARRRQPVGAPGMRSGAGPSRTGESTAARVTPAPSSGSARATADPKPSPSATAPESPGTAAGGGPRPGAGAGAADTGWVAVLNAADAARAAAFARLDSSGLLAADAAGSAAWGTDLAAMRQLRARGAAVRGLHEDLHAVLLRSASPDRVVLRLLEVLQPYSFVDAGGSVLATRPATPEEVNDVTLVRVHQQWRVSRVAPVSR